VPQTILLQLEELSNATNLFLSKFGGAQLDISIAEFTRGPWIKGNTIYLNSNLKLSAKNMSVEEETRGSESVDCHASSSK